MFLTFILRVKQKNSDGRKDGEDGRVKNDDIQDKTEKGKVYTHMYR